MRSIWLMVWMAWSVGFRLFPWRWGLFLISFFCLFLTMTIFCLSHGHCWFFPLVSSSDSLFRDTGALFIGFTVCPYRSPNATAVAVLRRWLSWEFPLQIPFAWLFVRLSLGQFYVPDQITYHRLLSLGLTHRGTVLVIYGISMILLWFLFCWISLLMWWCSTCWFGIRSWALSRWWNLGLTPSFPQLLTLWEFCLSRGSSSK